MLILDSGCTTHMTNRLDLLNNVFPHTENITTSSGKMIKSMSKGTLQALTLGGILRLQNVLHVSELKFSLLSVKKLIKQGINVKLLDNHLELYYTNEVIVIGESNQTDYKIILNILKTD
jgi:hypothetical protein